MKILAFIVYLFTFITLFSVSAFSQNKEGEIENQQIIVEKNRKIELPEVQRNFEKINIQRKTIEVQKQNYNYNDHSLNLPFLDAKFKILSIKEEPLTKLYGNYVKGGVGNYGTTYLEGFFYNKRNQKYAYGANLRHFASATGPVKNASLSDNHGLVYGKYFLPNHSVESELGYYRTVRHFYGYNHDIEVPKDSIRQIFNNFVWTTALKNNDSAATFKYGGNVEISHIKDRFEAKETEGLIRYRTQMILDSSATAGVRGLISIASRTDSTTYIRNLVSLQPYFQKKLDNFTITGGINFAFENDSVRSKKNFHLYPALKVEYLFEDYSATAFAGLDGNMERNTFRTIVRENPWMAERFILSHSNKTLDLNGGITGTAFTKFSYFFQLSYLNYKNLPFYINNGLDSIKFNLVYDLGTIKIVRFKADINYSLDKKMTAGVIFTYQNYKTVSLKQPWHVPKVQANYYFNFFFKEKIIFGLNSYMYSGIIGVDSKAKEVKLPTILDLNVKVDYLFSRNFSAFLELNNILANKYQRYLRYPSKGINFLIGVTGSF